MQGQHPAGQNDEEKSFEITHLNAHKNEQLWMEHKRKIVISLWADFHSLWWKTSKSQMVDKGFHRNQNILCQSNDSSHKWWPASLSNLDINGSEGELSYGTFPP